MSTRMKGLLQNTEQVKAIIDGRRTQFRVPIKEQPIKDGLDLCKRGNTFFWGKEVNGVIVQEFTKYFKLPYAVGDVLYVRETWGVGTRPCPVNGWIDGIEYRADIVDEEETPLHVNGIPDSVCLTDIKSGWRPSIHMPKWAARLFLEIVDVRAERVQEISEVDMASEGVDCSGYATRWKWQKYREAWESIYHNWDANPYTWRIEFKVVDKPVGEL